MKKFEIYYDGINWLLITADGFFEERGHGIPEIPYKFQKYIEAECSEIEDTTE
jgi:hypothetical protein